MSKKLRAKIWLGSGWILVAIGLMIYSGVLTTGRDALMTGALLLVGASLCIWGTMRSCEALLEREISKLELGVEKHVAPAVAHIENGLQRMEVSLQQSEIGLAEVFPDSSLVDYGSLISESHRLIVVLNDGRTWASVHRDRFRKRFVDLHTETTFILIHPESPMVDVLARKGSKEPGVIRERIQETIQLLEEIKTESTSLEILGHLFYNPFSIVLGDDSAIVTPYFLSRGGRTVPAFKYKDIGPGCYFRELAEDLEKLRMDTADISSRSRNVRAPGLAKVVANP